MPLSWMVQTAPKASPNLAQTLLGHKGLEMAAEGASLRAVALGTQVSAEGVSWLSRWGFSHALISSSANPLWFLSDGRAAVREAVLGPEAPMSPAEAGCSQEGRGRHAAPQRGPSPAELAPGPGTSCGTGLAAPAAPREQSRTAAPSTLQHPQQS